MELLDNVYYGNTVQAYAVAAAITFGIAATATLVRSVVASRLRKLAGRSKNHLDDLAIHTLESTRGWAILALALFVGSLYLEVDAEVATIVKLVAVVTLLLQIGVWGTSVLSRTVQDVNQRRIEAGDTAGLGAIQMLSLLGRIGVWVFVGLLILANVGVDIAALVAGLGIGGIAVALAMQNILSDLFASVSIVLDKPFQVGDFLIIDDFMGTVENIGLKTTRLRSLSGEQLVFSNGDLLGARVRNYKRMAERRAVFSFGVTYQTPSDEVERIPALVRELIEGSDRTRFDRAHFKSFGDSALIFEVVYYVLEPDFNLYMDIQQGINLALARELESRGVEFAYPTQTIFLNKVGGDES